MGVDRAREYHRRVVGQVARVGAVEPEYLCHSSRNFEQTAMLDAWPDRALLHRSYVLHSGVISPAATLSPNPLLGRLTVTAFLMME